MPNGPDTASSSPITESRIVAIRAAGSGWWLTPRILVVDSASDHEPARDHAADVVLPALWQAVRQPKQLTFVRRRPARSALRRPATDARAVRRAPCRRQPDG